jgi:hypothetical protein
MNRARQFRLLTIGLLLALVWLPAEARAAQCGSSAAGYAAPVYEQAIAVIARQIDGGEGTSAGR